MCWILTDKIGLDEVDRGHTSPSFQVEGTARAQVLEYGRAWQPGVGNGQGLVCTWGLRMRWALMVTNELQREGHRSLQKSVGSFTTKTQVYLKANCNELKKI